jgi:hypothetical protein
MIYRATMLSLLTLGLLFLLFMTGCAAPAEDTSEYDYSEPTETPVTIAPVPYEDYMFHTNVVKLPDGRHVTCVTLSRSAITCDWSSAE